MVGIGRRRRDILTFLAANPDSSNREIATSVGIRHESQISRLLSALAQNDLVAKRAEGAGLPNAWRLTPQGEETARALWGKAFCGSAAKASPDGSHFGARTAGGRVQAVAQQRPRLIGAMLETVRQKGCRAGTVADVIALAGVSSKTFYHHFPNKGEGFLAASDLISERATDTLNRAHSEAESWPERLEAAIRTLFEEAIENPGAVRLTLLELAALGPAGIERRERFLLGYERFIRDAMELAVGEGTMSETTLKAVVGGLTKVLIRRMLRGEHEQLLALVPDLVSWATSYYPTPPEMISQPLEGAGDDVGRRLGPQGGRAPGTLAPRVRLGARHDLRRGDQSFSHGFVVHSQRERILDAVANLTAAEGYSVLKVDDIADRAAVSLGAFYEHFSGKEDAFLVAYEVGHGKGLAIVERAYTAESDWR
ncbi:MAG TPA: TetR/AcrR family transcriptional regulator, partial [Solirubrobacteraceae bacterium]|nr:TetR/AcrR family transcriptional regulator [Solirubrobacteraceae bacterium]